MLRCAFSEFFACLVCLPAATFLKPEVFLLPVNLELAAFLLDENFLPFLSVPALPLVENDFFELEDFLLPHEENIFFEDFEDELDDRKLDREKERLLLNPLASASVVTATIGAKLPATKAAIAAVRMIFLNISPPKGRCTSLKMLSTQGKQGF